MPLGERIASVVILCLLAAIGAGVYLKGRTAPPAETLPLAGAAAKRAFRPAATLLTRYALTEAHDYNAENLYEYIDGQADRYVQFGFKALTVAEYETKEKGGAPIRIDLYDMGTRRNAYGIFNDSRPTEQAPAAFGNEGYVAGNLAAFWKSGCYLRVQGLADADMSAVVEQAAREAAGWIDDPIGRLAEFAAFDREGLQENALVFFKEAAFGLGYVNDAFIGEYEQGGKRCRLFFLDAGSASAAREILKKHEAFLAKGGTVEEALPTHVWGKEKYLGATWFEAQDRIVAGCLGIDDRAEASRRVAELLPRAAQALKGEAKP